VPNVRDDRETPLVWAGTARVLEVIWVKWKGENFSNEDWTGGITLIEQQNSFYSREPQRVPGCCAARRTGGVLS
jgi:hypothetical protein